MSSQDEARVGVSVPFSPDAKAVIKRRFSLGVVATVIGLFVIGAVIGGVLLWPAGEQVRLFSCNLSLMAQSPICRGYNQTDLLGFSVGDRVSTLGGWIGSMIGAAVGLILALTCIAAVRGRGAWF